MRKFEFECALIAVCSKNIPLDLPWQSKANFGNVRKHPEIRESAREKSVS